jgi:hypothetical protein
MRGKRCAGLRLTLLPAALLLGAVAAAAQNASPPAAAGGLPATIVVLDGSSSMNAKVGGAAKIATVRSALGQAVGAYAGRLSFGLVAYGHRKASNCADSETLANPGELTAETQDKLLDKVKPKGQAPVAAALSDAAKTADTQQRLDIILIADGGDTCDADICSTAVAMKEKAQGLRIHVVGYNDKADALKPLSCLAAATGGTFVAATNADELKQGLATVLDAVAATDVVPPAPSAAAEVTGTVLSGQAALPMGTATAEPIDLDAQAQAQSVVTSNDDLPPGTVATQPIELEPSAPQQVAQAEAQPAGATDVNKSPAPAPSVNVVQSVPIAPPPVAKMATVPEPPSPPTAKMAAVPEPTLPVAKMPAAPVPLPPPTKMAAAPTPQLPVPVTFKALITEAGPKLQNGLTWRVYESKAAGNSGYKLLSTHREAMPTAALLPGEYLVNAAYGLSNLTKKIKVESGRSLEETFVLNTGGLKLTALLPGGEALPESAVSFDVLSDEEDQFGNRHMILHNARPGIVIRLNAGAYRIESLYGDANATVKADVTVEPGKVTEATIKQTGSKTTFKLVQSLGGEALADTKWTILTSAGDVVKENAGALPTHILAPGSYAVVADHGGLSFTRKFSIETGDAKQIEVVVDDGPTSPEDLKALTDPPEPPPPPAGGVVAGDGQAPSAGSGTAFDGFSSTSPADPNAPLINPGALFRPSR